MTTPSRVAVLVLGVLAPIVVAREAQAGQTSFRDDVMANRQGLVFLWQLALDKPQTMDLAKSVTAAVNLTSFADRCRTYATLPAAKTTSTDAIELLINDPAGTCRLATTRMEIMKKRVPEILAFRRKYAGGGGASAREAMAAGKQMTAATLACAQDTGRCVDGQLEGAEEIEKALGLTSSPSASDAAAFKTAWKTAAATRRVGKLHDATREKLVKEVLARKSITPLAMGLYVAADDVKKDGSEPIKKYRGVSVVIRVGDEPFCRSYMAYASADYLGKGRYGALYVEPFNIENDSFLVSSCK